MAMKTVRALFVVLAFASSEASASTGDRTISKVVKMLQEMLDKSKEDGEQEREVYAKFKCYSDNTQKAKEDSIEKLTNSISELENSIESLKGESGSLSLESAELQQSINANEASVAEAEAIRKSSHEAFLAEEEDLTKADDQMGKAVDVLSAMGGSSLLAQENSHFMVNGGGKAGLVKLRATVKQALLAASSFLKPVDQHKVEVFLQAPAGGSSSGIVGILKSMKETFVTNLENARSAEAAGEEAFTKFKATKETELTTMQDSLNGKQAKLGDNDGELATKKTQLEENIKQKEADEAFLADLLKNMKEKTKEYEDRSLLRASEDAAIAKAIAILNSDSAFATFGKVSATRDGATSFLQISTDRAAKQGQNALKLLQRASLARRSTRLARIAGLLITGNPFTRVLDEIDKMQALIAKEGQQDQEELDWCNSERTSSDASHAEKVSEISELETAIAGLDETLNHPETGLKKQIEDSETSLEENQKSQKEATVTREAEHKEFQEQIAHADEAISLLGSAIAVLQRYYKAMDAHQAGTALVQRGSEEPPETWSGDYSGQSEQGASVIEMLEFVKGETKKEMDTAIKDDDQSKTDYESTMVELTTKEKELQESITRLHKEVAEAEEELAAKKEDLVETEEMKASIEKYLAQIKPGCDFITANIAERDANRAAEKDALEQAKTLLKDTPAYKKASAES